MKHQIEIRCNPCADAQERRDKAEDRPSLATEDRVALALEDIHVVDTKLVEMIDAVSENAYLQPLLRGLTDARMTLVGAQYQMLAILEGED